MAWRRPQKLPLALPVAKPKPQTIRLNRSEQGALAVEGYFGPVNLVYILRFDRPVPTETLRQALWDLMMAHPRLRIVLEPGWLNYHLRVLDDPVLLRQLFAQTLIVHPQPTLTSTAAIEAAHTHEINQLMPLQRGLPFRITFDPHVPQPVLIFNVHHMVGDGRSMARICQNLLSLLHGQAIEVLPVESSSQLPGLLPHHAWDWPQALWGWWQGLRRDAQRSRGGKVILLGPPDAQRYSICTVEHVDLPCSVTDFKSAARSMGTTLNTLLLACVAQVLLSMRREQPDAMAVLRVAVDLRKYYPHGRAPRVGNTVVNLVLYARHQANLPAQAQDLHQQVQDHLGRIERREVALPHLLLEWLSVINLRWRSKLALNLKASGGLSRTSCFISNLGNGDALVMDGASGPVVTDFRAACISPSLYSAVTTLGENITMVFTWQHADQDPEQIKRLFSGLRHEVASLQAMTEVI
jgi:NRPS condensation-like uncharacterized protein